MSSNDLINFKEFFLIYLLVKKKKIKLLITFINEKIK